MGDFGVLDLEFDGEPWSGELLCVGWRNEAYQLPLPPAVLDELADPSIVKVAHTKADHRWLGIAGIEVRGEIHDTQGMAWLLDEAQPLDLESLAAKYCRITMDKRIAQMGGRLYFTTDEGERVPLREAPKEQLLAYNVRDLEATANLYDSLLAHLRQRGLYGLWEATRVPFTSCLVDMEVRGLPIDLGASESLRGYLEVDVDLRTRMLLKEAGLPPWFNLNSDLQMRGYLYETLFEVVHRIEITPEQRTDLKAGMDPHAIFPPFFMVGKVGRKYAHGTVTLAGRGLPIPGYTENGEPTTAAPKLRAAFPDDPWISGLLAMRQIETVCTNFLARFPERESGGRLRGRFNDTGTVTGRLSSDSPNLQNIPSRSDLGYKVRQLFRPEPGYVFVHGDYSQLEPRIMAHLSQDPALMAIYAEGTEGDVYADMARGIWGSVDKERRGICKTLYLAMSYIAGPDKIAENLTQSGYPTNSYRAKKYVAGLRATYPRFFEWREELIDGAKRAGGIWTMAERPRRLLSGDERATHWKEMDGGRRDRQAVNSAVQGSAADIVSATMVDIWQKVDELDILVQVHDELLLEGIAGTIGPEQLSRVQEIAETPRFGMSVPLVFAPRIVGSWAEGKD